MGSLDSLQNTFPVHPWMRCYTVVQYSLHITFNLCDGVGVVPVPRDSWCGVAENMQLLSAAVLTMVKPLKDDTLLLIACLVVFLAMKSLIVNCRFILKQTNDWERNFIYC